MTTVLDRVRTYAETEPSFTARFAAWELDLSYSSVWLAVVSLLKSGELREIESACGPYGATYEWVRPMTLSVAHDRERESALQRAVLDALDNGPLRLARLASVMQLPKERLKPLLDGLVSDGRVVKSGQTKGTRYGRPAVADRSGTAQLRVVTGGTAPRELDDREVAYTTEAGPRALAG